ncbi:MAG TPA: hypothetical protein VLN72_09325, partial [Gillisia sp.]|nr:hypothetical protein [Gillisia sp.]
MGANTKSKVFYNRIKGEMEEAVLAQKIEHTFIFQPSLIAGDREEKRVFEDLAKKAMKVLNFVLRGPLEKYRSIHPETIATAMLKVERSGFPRTRIQSPEIKEIAKQINKHINNDRN